MAGHINCLRLTRFNEKDRRDSIKQRVTVSNIYALLTTREVKMAGYWPSSYFAILWTETKSRSIKTQKKRTRPISSHLDRTSLVNKGFIIWPKGYTN